MSIKLFGTIGGQMCTCDIVIAIHSLFLFLPSPPTSNPSISMVATNQCQAFQSHTCYVVGWWPRWLKQWWNWFLRNVTNYLIVSLAFSDLLVGFFVMPLATMLEVWEPHASNLSLGINSVMVKRNSFYGHNQACDGYWPLGRDICDIFHSLDVLGSTASIWNLCAISLDRYIAITGLSALHSYHGTNKENIFLSHVFTGFLVDLFSWSVLLNLSQTFHMVDCFVTKLAFA